MRKPFGRIAAVTAVVAIGLCGSAVGAVPAAGPARTAAERGAGSEAAFAEIAGAGFAAYATGTVFHTDPALTPGESGTEIDLGVSDAAYASAPLAGFADELGRRVTDDLTGGSGFARGLAVRITPLEALGSAGPSAVEPAESKAPPSGAPVSKSAQIDLSPALRADTFKADALARAVVGGCVIGPDLARASGAAIDTDLVEPDPDTDSTEPLLSVGDDRPPRAVLQSTSVLRLQPIADRPNRFGAVAETRQTIAPVTFGIPGTDVQFTVEVGGEWVLRAATDGRDGAVKFGPEGGGDRPALRLIQDGDVTNEVGLRQIGGRTGIYIDGRPVADVRIGGDPRPVHGDAGSDPVEEATRVSAAADVAVVRLFNPPAELRVGHMEVGLAVPAGGVECPGITLTKTSNPPLVGPRDNFAWILSVTNPNDCLLEQVNVVDTPTAAPDVGWRSVTSNPKARTVGGGSIAFDTIGPLRLGETKLLRINSVVEELSATGTITNRATATGTCGGAPVAGAGETVTTVGLPVTAPAAPGSVPVPVPGSAAGTGPAGPDGGAASSAGAQRSAAGAVADDGPAAAAPATSSAAAGRRARGAAAGGAAESDSTSTAAALAGTGAAVLPYLMISAGFLAGGALLRRRGRARRA